MFDFIDILLYYIFTSNMEAIDTPYAVTNNVHNIVNAGYHGFLRYISPDTPNFPNKQLRAGEASAIHSVPGTGIGMVYETNPTSAGYFAPGKGVQDANDAIAAHSAAGAPQTVPIFFAVDYDASGADINGAILGYFADVHSTMSGAGLLTGIYGSGDACQAMKNAGVVHYTWLAQSRGWSGYGAWKTSADIVQGPTGNIAGIDLDTDYVVNEAVLWTA
jgi:hypothetical protein